MKLIILKCLALAIVIGFSGYGKAQTVPGQTGDVEN